VRPAGSDTSIEVVRGFIRQEQRRRHERDREVRRSLRDVRGKGERRRTAALIATSYGLREVR
jgi:hypothetical protein